MPSYQIERVGDLQEEPGSSEFALALADDQTLFAARRTNNSYLKCSHYSLNAGGDIVHQGSGQSPSQAANIALTSPGSGLAISSSVKIAGSKLHVTEWHPSQGSNAEGGSASHSAIASFTPEVTIVPPGFKGPGKDTAVKFPSGKVAVTAHTTPSGQQLRISAWLTEGAGGVQDLAMATDSQRHTKIAIVAHTADEETQTFTAITATRANGYKLRLAHWRIRLTQRQELRIERIGEAQTEHVISEVSATVFSRTDGDYVAAAVIRDGKLAVITWKINADGSFTPWQEATAGAAAGIACAHLRQSDIAVACRDASNKLRVIYWRFPNSNSGSQAIVRMGTATAGALDNISSVAIVHTSSTLRKPGDSIVACKTSAGKLKLIRFRLTPGA